MISVLLLILSFSIFANPLLRWNKSVEIVDKHEFYPNNEVIAKPVNTWQTLLGLVYPSSDLTLKKDCVFYRIPGDELGILKVKTVSPSESCELFQMQKGDWEKSGIKALRLNQRENSLSFEITYSKYRVENWRFDFFNRFVRSAARPLMSSAEYKQPKIIFLAPSSEKLTDLSEEKPASYQLVLCHDISEDCREKFPSRCESCPEGWFEIPNGCQKAPKYCGHQECGKKNQPACSRGFRYQRQNKSYDCRTDSSFAFCAKGLKVHCEGNLAYCN